MPLRSIRIRRKLSAIGVLSCGAAVLLIYAATFDEPQLPIFASVAAASMVGSLLLANQLLTQIQVQHQALLDSEGRVRAVLNSALSAVIVIEGDGKVADWNHRAEAMFGWKREIGRAHV